MAASLQALWYAPKCSQAFLGAHAWADYMTTIKINLNKMVLNYG
jgi:hypothetical protein